MKKFLIYFTLIFILAVISAALYGNFIINQKIDKTQPLKINIPKGSGIAKVVEILNKEGIAEPAKYYVLYLKYLTYIKKQYIQAGVYLFPENLTTQELLDAMFKGEYLYVAKVTFPEGIGYQHFASLLKHKILVDSVEFVRLAQSDSLLKSHSIPTKNVDGYLLPDTYEFYMESSASEIIDKLLNHHKKMYDRILSQSSNSKNFTKHEVLTLASIVEAETPEDDERVRVAGLYINRLDKGMLLQADPTVAYFLNGKKRILYSDLKINNPYNTYINAGLPPGPINNPGSKSIRAALNHENHDYYYMVTVGDGTRRHNFSKTYTEHQRYVAEFRKRVSQIKK
ncbi:MAG: endolytic transglycosylase MltG [Candidatus Kapabacteria bacterium]|nr:endolytic transglycosylase MltG [Ignavibacteriota bacterium]MCW5886199.1 endolytic transglycosylase MltG [Candidatus Kapabacteria bacterium]